MSAQSVFEVNLARLNTVDAMPKSLLILKLEVHHTWQAFSATIGCPALHPHAFWNSGMFCTTPSTRYFPGECGSVNTRMRATSGRRFSHHTRPNPRKNRCSGV